MDLDLLGNLPNEVKNFISFDKSSLTMNLDMKRKKHFFFTCAHIMIMFYVLTDWLNEVGNVDCLDLDLKDMVNRFKGFGMRIIILICTCILFYDLIHEDMINLSLCQKGKSIDVKMNSTTLNSVWHYTMEFWQAVSISDIPTLIDTLNKCSNLSQQSVPPITPISKPSPSSLDTSRSSNLSQQSLPPITPISDPSPTSPDTSRSSNLSQQSLPPITPISNPSITSLDTSRSSNLSQQSLPPITQISDPSPTSLDTSRSSNLSQQSLPPITPISNPSITWLDTSRSSNLSQQSLPPIIPIFNPSPTSNENKSSHPPFVSRFLTDFTEIKKIGSGGQGDVFKAKNIIDNLTYAIKKIPQLNGQKKVKAALREAKALANLDHKNIVRYFNAWTEKPPYDWIDPYKNLSMAESDSYITSSNDLTYSDDIDELSEFSYENIYLYIQTEWCHNGSLREWLDENKDPSIRKKNYVSIFEQILGGVEYIHKKGMMHRDLKPSNIFLSIDGKIKIGDFGLVGTIREHKECIGTELYMSPEQLERKTYNFKVDIWSLGLIFFEFLFPMNTEMERIRVFKNLQKQNYPEEFKIKYPNEYSLLLLMMSSDPNKRPTTSELRAHPPFSHQTDFK